MQQVLSVEIEMFLQKTNSIRLQTMIVYKKK